MLVIIIYLAIVCIILICIIENADIILIPSDLKADVFIIKILSFFIGIIFVVDIYLFIEFLDPSITPMDVYSGKTTLEYTVIDGIKTDSCVVWKK